MTRLSASRAATDLIKSFEGFRARAARLPDGRFTIGYGHVATAREGAEVSRAQADDLLRWDLRPVEDAVRQWVLAPLTQSQFDALVSFASNIGLDAFRSSATLRHVNQGEPVAAALAMGAWRKARINGRLIMVDALVRRRSAEVALFLEPTGPRPAAPTPVVAPEIDHAAALLAPVADPIVVGATLEGGDAQGVAGAPEAGQGAEGHDVADPSADPVETAQDGEAGPDALPVSPPVTPVPAPSPLEAATLRLGNTVDAIFLDTGLQPFPGTEAERSSGKAANGPPAPPAPGANDTTPVLPPAAPVAPPVPGDGGRKTPVEDIAAGLSAPLSLHRLGLIVLTALGAALLAGGLWHASEAGALALRQPDAPPLAPGATAALLAAAIGLVLALTGAAGLVLDRGDTVDAST